MRHQALWRRGTRVAIAATAIVAVVLSSSPAQAQFTPADPAASTKGSTNPYAPSYQHPYRHGAVPTRSAKANIDVHQARQSPATAAANNLRYGGGVDGIGVTTGHPQVYLVFWGSNWGANTTDGKGDLNFGGDPAAGAPVIQELFKGLGSGGLFRETWSGVMAQYCETSVGSTSCQPSDPHVGFPYGQALYGVWYDNRVISNQPSAVDIAQEAVAAAGHFGNTTPATNRNAQYIILSPHNSHPDGFGAGGNFCAWHFWNGGLNVNSPYGDIAFSNMPYVMDLGADCGAGFFNPGAAGALDGYTMVVGHEYAETITDQLPAGGWTDGNDENADKCAWIQRGLSGGPANFAMTTGHFVMQSTWSNEDNGCLIARSLVAIGDPGPQTITLGQSLNITLSTTRGTAPYSFYGVVLPPGVTVSAAGLIGGAPSAAGVYTVKVGVLDANAFVNETSFSLAVNQPTVVVPGVWGLPRAQATSIISARGLIPSVSTTKACIDPGSVLSQSPSGGESVPLGSTVFLQVDSGTLSTCGVIK
jgi:PASTA domain/Putative Ig domain